jgi:hypothetical protein
MQKMGILPMLFGHHSGTLGRIPNCHRYNVTTSSDVSSFTSDIDFKLKAFVAIHVASTQTCFSRDSASNDISQPNSHMKD